MGMTRDEALKVWLPIIQTGVKTMPECKEALDMAIDTIHKYQKIQEIYQWAKDRSYLVESDDIMDKLKEVVEDGQNIIKD